MFDSPALNRTNISINIRVHRRTPDDWIHQSPSDLIWDRDQLVGLFLRTEIKPFFICHLSVSLSTYLSLCVQSISTSSSVRPTALSQQPCSTSDLWPPVSDTAAGSERWRPPTSSHTWTHTWCLVCVCHTHQTLPPHLSCFLLQFYHRRRDNR